MRGGYGMQRKLQKDQGLYNRLNGLQLEVSGPYLDAKSDAPGSRSSFPGYLAEYCQYFVAVFGMLPSYIQEG
jgi:hypothetical protein